MSNINYFDLFQNLYELGYWHNKCNESNYAKIISYNWDFMSILSIGCSTGNAVGLYKNQFHKNAYGIDVCISAICEAGKKGLDCQVASGLDIPFKSNSFDAVSLINVLEYIHQGDIIRFISEIQRVARHFIFFKVDDNPEDNKKWANKIRQKTGAFKNLISIQQSSIPIDTWIHLFEKNSDFSYRQIKNGIVVLGSKKVV